MAGELLFVLLGAALGTITRLLVLKADYRRYPTTPNGQLIQVTLGFIAAAMGAVTVPALLARDWVAVTFLALAIQQLRQVRDAERRSLTDLETTEFVPRGAAYVDALAKAFEARNYIALLVGLVTSGVGAVARSAWGTEPALAAAVAAGALSARWLLTRTGHRQVGDLARIETAPVRVEGYDVFVGDIYVMNVGLAATRERIRREALGVILTPKDTDAAIALAHPGQRRAIESDLARVLGTERYLRTRRDFDTGRVALLVVPIRDRRDQVLRVIAEAPLLESVKRSRT